MATAHQIAGCSDVILQLQMQMTRIFPSVCFSTTTTTCGRHFLRLLLQHARNFTCCVNTWHLGILLITEVLSAKTTRQQTHCWHAKNIHSFFSFLFFWLRTLALHVCSQSLVHVTSTACCIRCLQARWAKDLSSKQLALMHCPHKGMDCLMFVCCLRSSSCLAYFAESAVCNGWFVCVAQFIIAVRDILAAPLSKHSVSIAALISRSRALLPRSAGS